MKRKRCWKTGVICLSLAVLLSVCALPTSSHSLWDPSETVLLHEDTRELSWGQSSTPRPSAARERLGSTGRALYDALLPVFSQIASGEEESTVIRFDRAELVDMGTRNQYPSEESVMSGFYGDMELEDVLNAVLHDCPYELYWFDKTNGVSYRVSVGEEDGYYYVNDFYMIYSVAKAYRGSAYPLEHEQSPDLTRYTVDTEKTAERADLPEVAMQIVAEAEGRSDYSRLLYYAQRICAMTDYNSDVANAGEGAIYGDAFQLTYVFDGDPSTKTVCEGYSKAFQYLCDLTAFQDPTVACYTLVGNADGEPHMWNLVTMGDGKTYLMDVTNSDDGAIGEDGGFLLAGAAGSPVMGYRVSAGAFQSVLYQYRTDLALDFWGLDEGSPLILSASSYTPSDIFVYIPNLTYDGEALTVGFPESGMDIICSLELGNDGIGSYTWSYGWYADQEGVEGNTPIDAPKDAGVYWLRVRAIGMEIKDKTVKVTILPAPLTVENVAVEEKIYDGTAEIRLTSLTLSGSLEGDDVVPKSFEGTLPSADAGEYDRVTVHSVLLEGEDAKNYCVLPTETSCTARILPKKLSKATLILSQVEYDYTGKEIIPEVKLMDGKTLIDPAEYAVTAKNNVEAGEATVTVVDREGGNYEIEPVTAAFLIVGEAPPLENSTNDPISGDTNDWNAEKILLVPFALVVGYSVMRLIVRFVRRSRQKRNEQ